MRDCYQIVGTNRIAIYSGEMKGNEISIEKKRDEFIKEKFVRKINLLEAKLDIVKSPERKEELKAEIKETIEAYEQIKNTISRENYNRQMDEQYQKNSALKKIKKRNAYNILATTRETIDRKSEEEANQLLRHKRNELLSRYQELLENSTSFSEKEKILLVIQEVNEAYQTLKNADKRNIYNMKVKKEDLKQKFSHVDEYNPNLIANAKKDDAIIEQKMVIRKQVNGNEYFLDDIEKRKLRIQQTGRIVFKNYQGIVITIDEYKVTRGMQGKEISDTIYADLTIPELSINKSNGQKINEEYYNCVVNKLLSEDTIEGSQFNSGYIGEVERNQEGKYDITLDKGPLNIREQEKLTAILEVRNKELKKQSQKQR